MVLRLGSRFPAMPQGIVTRGLGTTGIVFLSVTFHSAYNVQSRLLNKSQIYFHVVIEDIFRMKTS